MALERLSQITESGIKNGITISNASVTGVLTATSEFNVGSGLTITSTSSGATLTSSSVTVTGNSTVSGNSFVDGKLGIGTDSVSLNTLSVGSNPRGYTSYALIHNPSGVGATTRAELSDNAALIIQPHATDSIHMAFGHVNNGAGMGIQVTNYAKNADWDICLNPFGGDVGIGNTNPQSKLDVSGEIRASGIAITESYPTIRPSLNLDFTNSRSLDSRITFTRASTATYVGRDGLIKTAGVDEARFDHDPSTGESLGLLIEEARTNLITYSNHFGLGSSWNTIRATVTINQTVAPDGTLTADLLEPIVTPSGGYTRFYINVTTGTTYTFSFFAKYQSSDFPYISVYAAYEAVSGSGRNVNYFNVQNGTLGSGFGSTYISHSIQDYGNGWYRCIITTTADVTGSVPFVIFPAEGDLDMSYVSDGVGGIYIWGAQLEQGSSPTSYIPTSSSSVTRQPDNAQITGTNLTSFYNQSKGTLFTSFRPLPLSTGSRYVQSSTIGSTLEAFYIRSTPTGSDSAIIDGGVTQAYNLINYTRSEQENSKHAYAYELNNFGVSAQGQLGSGDTSCTMPTITRFDIGSLYQDSATFLNGYISQLFYYPARISDIKLQQMTKVFS